MHTVQLALTIAMLATPLFAYETPGMCDSAALVAAETYGIPPQVMLAISRVETGRQLDGELRPWPWAINAAGQPHWFESRDEAAEFVDEAMNQGLTNIDIGCFQLNLRWHGSSFHSIEHMLDPAENADYAAQFLVENYERTGTWVDAVAAYHSLTPEYAEAYVEKVEAVLKTLHETAGTDRIASAEVTRPAASNNFPLLQAGTSGSIASLVPSAGLARPLFAMAP